MKRILLVDDDQVHHVVTGMLLKRLPFEIETERAMNGLEAVEILEDDAVPAPDLILLDLNMPVMNGWEFLTEFDRLFHDRILRPVIVILSSTIAPDDIEKANHYKAVHSFISKPLLKDKMIQLLTSLDF